MSYQSETYQKKRNRQKTAKCQDKSSIKGNRFVIHKHDATNLHYDFRLQAGDVLISWAVPKGLSTVTNEKRLAIRTENHPLDYADFEGVISEGEYGAGTVMIWDKGEYELIPDNGEASIDQGMQEGALKFNLKGDKLEGGYAMARMRIEKNEEQWVIFKLDDKYADDRQHPLKIQPDSVLTGRTLDEIAKDNNNE